MVEVDDGSTENPSAAAPEADASWFERRAGELFADNGLIVDAWIFSLFFNFLNAANATTSIIEAEAFRPRGLTWGSFRTLFTLMVLGEMHPGQIARRSGVSDAAVSGVLKTLEGQGHIERTIDADDRRRVKVSITETGRRLALDAYKAQHVVESRLVAGFSDGEREFVEVAARRLLLTVRGMADG